MGSSGPDVDDYVDMLITGAGPAGLMMANWMSRCGVRTRIVDKRGTKIFNGQADGLSCRTLEVFDSFDIAHRVVRESNQLNEICLWNPDAESGHIVRGDRIPDMISGTSRFKQVVLHQGRIERFLLDSIREHSVKTSCNGEGDAGEIRVEHGVMPVKFEFDESLADDGDAYPITVTLRHLSEEEATPKQSGTDINGKSVSDGIFRSNLAEDDTAELIRRSGEVGSKAGKEEVVKAKYMLGADGAHSWLRNQLGFKLEGDSTDYVWGVVDIIPLSDFPDIRMCCAIRSKSSGSILLIPRERKIVRLYVQLTTTDGAGGARADRSTVSPETIIACAQKIMHPYKIEYKYLDWWTAYQIGQRVGDHFSLHERVFLAGDAVHTHSPKVGQGMNVSMQDAYSLGWKIAHVVKGIANRSILKTYESERRKVAQELIDIDHRFSRLYSGRPAKDVMDEEGISLEDFRGMYEKGKALVSGVAVDYAASMIVAGEDDGVKRADGTHVMGKNDLQVHSKQELATEVVVGRSMPSFRVLNQADAHSMHFQRLLMSNGSWRIVVFAGNIKADAQKSRLESLGKKLEGPESFLKRYTPANKRHDSVIELLLVHSAPRQQTTIFDLPEVFRPWDDDNGWDYWKVYVDDVSYHDGHGEAYKNYGIDKETGCAVILRPDQHVSWVGDVDDYDSMDKFFAGFMIEQTPSHAVLAHSDKSSLKSGQRAKVPAGVAATDEAVKVTIS